MWYLKPKPKPIFPSASRPSRLWGKRDQSCLRLHHNKQDLTGRQDGAGADPDGEVAGEVEAHELIGRDSAEVAAGRQGGKFN